LRVRRCFAFLDLCGFTAYADGQGDEAAVAMLADLRAAVRMSAEHHGVRVTKWLGDGVMLSGIDEEAVVACVSKVRADLAGREALPLRGGISTGMVIMFEGDDYIGGAVNVAARLCDAAAPGQVLMAVEGVGPSDALPVEVRGVSRTVRVQPLDAG
jgi:adenylate cyclase